MAFQIIIIIFVLFTGKSLASTTTQHNNDDDEIQDISTEVQTCQSKSEDQNPLVSKREI